MEPKRELTESQAWEEIARAFDGIPSKKSHLETDLSDDGICAAIEWLWYKKLITETMRDKMLNPITKQLGGMFEYAYGYSRKDDILRADYAMLQKYIVESEEK